MSILVYGKTGQVGKALNQFEDVVSLARNEANFLNPYKCAELVNRFSPKVVINAVAKTNVDKCEKEKSESDLINTITPIEIAKVCKKNEIPFIQISSDYVFDGKSSIPYKESDLTNPVNYYGATKLNAENEILKLNFNSVILRTSWVFSTSKTNFIFKIKNQIQNKKKINVVFDQEGSPTSAKDIAKTCFIIANSMKDNKKLNKIYHYSSYPSTNFYEYAKEILTYTDNDTKLNKIKSVDYSQDVLRPKFTYLNCDLLKNDLAIDRPNWKKSLKKILEKN